MTGYPERLEQGFRLNTPGTVRMVNYRPVHEKNIVLRHMIVSAFGIQLRSWTPQ
jgi:hypothetical protein